MKEYKFLKTAKNIFKVLSWVVLALSIIVGVIVLVTGGGAPIVTPDGTTMPATPRATGVVFMIMGAFYFLILYTISEMISILLDIKDSCSKPAV
jgi:amino acid transporter